MLSAKTQPSWDPLPPRRRRRCCRPLLLPPPSSPRVAASWCASCFTWGRIHCYQTDKVGVHPFNTTPILALPFFTPLSIPPTQCYPLLPDRQGRGSGPPSPRYYPPLNATLSLPPCRYHSHSMLPSYRPPLITTLPHHPPSPPSLPHHPPALPHHSLRHGSHPLLCKGRPFRLHARNHTGRYVTCYGTPLFCILTHTPSHTLSYTHILSPPPRTLSQTGRSRGGRSQNALSHPLSHTP